MTGQAEAEVVEQSIADDDPVASRKIGDRVAVQARSSVEEAVGAGTARERVRASAAGQRVVAGFAVEAVGCGTAGQAVGPAPA